MIKITIENFEMEGTINENIAEIGKFISHLYYQSVFQPMLKAMFEEFLVNDTCESVDYEKLQKGIIETVDLFIEKDNKVTDSQIEIKETVN